MKRKGIGYVIEIMASLLVIFIFVLGNSPGTPDTDISTLQKDVVAEDLTISLKKAGDIEYFLRNGGTGSLKTEVETMGRERISLSGTVKNLPVGDTVVGFHILESDRKNESLDTVSNLNDQCYQDNDLEEIDSSQEILRTEDQEEGVYLYIGDTDPQAAEGTGGYDTVYVDNGTTCQFSSAEGPHYIEEFIYWGDGPGGDHYDVKNIYGDSDLELYRASQVVDIGKVMKQRVNGIDTNVEIDTTAAEFADLDNFDTLVFRENTAITEVLNPESGRIKEFMGEGNILLLMDLERDDFFNGNTPKDNFITDTGFKWVGMEHDTQPQDASFTQSELSGDVRTYFRGMYDSGDGLSNVNLEPSGNITSSNGRLFKDRAPILRSSTGRYRTSEWNATNYTMDPVDPSSIDGYPETACVEDSDPPSSSLTRGVFGFYDYQNDEFREYTVINTEMGGSTSICNDRDVRALNIDINGNGEYDNSGEGPFLDGEIITVENKSFQVYFPDTQSFETGEKAEFVYMGDRSIELVSHRTGFKGFSGGKLARLEYRDSYNQDERKLISAVLYWLSDDIKEFGGEDTTDKTSETIGGIKENTFIPYKLLLRWSE